MHNPRSPYDICNCMFQLMTCFQWNIADHFSQTRLKIKDDLESKEQNEKSTALLSSSGENNSLTTSAQQQAQQSPNALPPFDNLWMSLYLRLGQLCVDQRPAVRKSAGQTLFSMIGAHGQLLQNQSWHTMLWKVSFCCSFVRCCCCQKLNPLWQMNYCNCCNNYLFTHLVVTLIT